MNGNNLFNEAARLLGYSDESGKAFPAVAKRGNAIVTAICRDVCQACAIDYEPPKDMQSEIRLDERIVGDCMVYGVAMMIAQGENDADNQRFYATLYEYKCAYYSKKAIGSVIEDVLP